MVTPDAEPSAQEITNIPDNTESPENVVSDDTHNFSAALRSMTDIWELPANQVESILRKALDIDEDNTAFSIVNDEQCEQIFQTGLVGNTIDTRFKVRLNPLNEWEENVKKRNAVVQFNIVGREQGNVSKTSAGTRMSRSYWVHPGRVGILFKISRFRELVPRYMVTIQKPHTFRGNDTTPVWNRVHDFKADTPIDDPLLQRNMRGLKHVTPEGKPIIHGEFGFVLSPRVAPRLFTGVVFTPGRLHTEAEIQQRLEEVRTTPWGSDAIRKRQMEFVEQTMRHGQGRYARSGTINAEDIRRQVEELASMQLHAHLDHPERLLPIYDTDGNMYWPKSIPYAELKLKN